MREIITSIDIAATPERVWAVLSDLPGYPQWNPFIREASGELAVGSTLTLRMVLRDRRIMTVTPTVLAVEPGHELRWRGRSSIRGLFSGDHRFLLTPTGGGTLLVHSEKFSGLLVPFVRNIIDSVSREFAVLNEALRDRVEKR